MDEVTENAIRKSLHLPEEELLTVWRLLGYRDCPLDNSEQGVANCPMGFDTGRWSPNNLPAWMRERLSEELLTYCQQCRGDLKHSSQQVQAWSNVYEILAGGGK